MVSEALATRDLGFNIGWTNQQAFSRGRQASDGRLGDELGS